MTERKIKSERDTWKAEEWWKNLNSLSLREIKYCESWGLTDAEYCQNEGFGVRRGFLSSELVILLA
jgi:hypothetical protein